MSKSGAQFDRLVQERRNSSALAMELRLSCINPLHCSYVTYHCNCGQCVSETVSFEMLNLIAEAFNRAGISPTNGSASNQGDAEVMDISITTDEVSHTRDGK